MSKIKTRERVRDIKVLDKSLVAGERMKQAFIRSKQSTADLMDNSSASSSEYAESRVEHSMEGIGREASYVTFQQGKRLARKGRESLQEHLSHEQEGGSPSNSYAEEPHRPQSDGRTYEPQRSAPTVQRESMEHPTQSPTERGRQLAKDKAKTKVQEKRRIKSRAELSVRTYDNLVRSDIPSPGPESVHSTSRADRIRHLTTDKTIKTAKQTDRTIKQTARTTGKAAVKSSKRTIKTAERTSKSAIKTAQATAKTAEKSAKAAAKASQKAAQAARVAAKTAAEAAKVAAKAVATTVKAIIAAVKSLVAAIAAGGWVAVVAIVIICLIGLLVASCFGIFFSGEDTGTGQSMPTAVREINQEYEDRLEKIKANNSHDTLEMAGSRAVWPDVLAIYSVKTTTDPDNAQEVASMDDGKKALLKEVFWAMNEISYRTESHTTTSTVEAADEDGNIVTEEVEETVTTLYITVTHKTVDDMALQYGFNEEQKAQLAELLSEENRSLWSSVLYGIGIGDGEIVTVALSQIGNVGGQPYWSWYGFGSRVEWCACFVSWCANECGYIDAGVIPKFAGCVTGVQWFRDRGLWMDNAAEPRPGDIIFFDWNNPGGSSGPQDGEADHVGIVEKVENGIVYTIEGNSGDSCRENHYPIGYYEILGYGCPQY